MSRNFLAPVLTLLLGLGFAPAAFATDLIPGIYQTWNDESLAGIATLNGNLTVTLPHTAMSATLDANGNLRSMGGSSEIHAALTADVVASGSGAVNVNVPLAVIPMPIIPVNAFTVIQPYIGLLGNVTGTVEAGARFCVMEQLQTTIEMSLDSSGVHASLFGNPEFQHHAGAPEITGATGVNLSVSIICGVTFQIVVYGLLVGGPTLAVQFGVDLSANPAANPWWDLNGSLVISTSFVGPGFVVFTTVLHQTNYDFDDANGAFPALPAAPTRWSKTYSLGDNEDVRSVAPLSDGFLVTGNAAGVSCHGYLAKLDLSGTPVWEKRGQILAFGSFRPSAVVEARNGDILVGGGSGVSGGGNAGARIERFDSAGNPLWAKILDITGNDSLLIQAMIGTADGGVIYAGRVTHYPTSDHPLVGKLDSNGAAVWTKEFDFGAASTYGIFEDVIATADGGLFLTGTVDYENAPYPNNTIDQMNFLAVKLDGNQAVQFARVIGTTTWDDGYAAAEGDDGTLVVAGHSYGTGHAAVVAGLAPDGQTRFMRCYAGEEIAGSSGDTPYDSINDVLAVDGGFVLTGYTGLPSAVRDTWLLGIDWDGATTFFKSYRADDYDVLQGVVALDEGYLAYGSTESLDPSVPSVNDFWLARTSFDGQLDFTVASGFECWNDNADWGTAGFLNEVMPGSIADFTITITAGAHGYDAVATTVTSIAP